MTTIDFSRSEASHSLFSLLSVLGIPTCNGHKKWVISASVLQFSFVLQLGRNFCVQSVFEKFTATPVRLRFRFKNIAPVDERSPAASTAQQVTSMSNSEVLEKLMSFDPVRVLRRKQVVWPRYPIAAE